MKTFGIIANGKPIAGVSVTTFMDWEDIAAAELNQLSKNPINYDDRFKSQFHHRLASQGAEDIRLFPAN